MMKWSYQSPRRGGSTKERPFGEFDACIGGWEIEGEPYTKAEGTKFDWWRARMLGGRTNHWGRISLRFGPDDFKAKSHDGLGDDWPISYDDMAPYYDKVDRLIGVFGSKEGLENDPDGIFLPPPPPRLGEHFVKKAATGLGIKVIAGRGSVLTAPLPGNNDRQPCFYCGQCNRSCKIYGDFSSSSCLVIPAIKTGNLTVTTGAIVREILTGNDGLASGVSYINKDDGQEYQIKAKTVILAASTCESARILLNSRSPQHPTALPTAATPSGNTCTTLPRAGAQPSFLNSSTARALTRTASAACTFTRPGGWTAKRSTSRAATTSRSSAGCGCPAMAAI